MSNFLSPPAKLGVYPRLINVAHHNACRQAFRNAEPYPGLAIFAGKGTRENQRVKSRDTATGDGTQFTDARASAAWRALMTSTRWVWRSTFEISRRLIMRSPNADPK